MTRRRPSEVFIDSNLLVLLAVGATDRDLIGKHRRSREFEAADYDRLAAMIRNVDKVLVTPNTLTEASNLIGQHGEPERSRCYDTLRLLIGESREIVVHSVTASRNVAFNRLGLTDAALLEAISPQRPLLTVDLPLYVAALAEGEESAINFAHYQFRGA